MKKTYILLVALFAIISCNKENTYIPLIRTLSTVEINDTSVKVISDLINDGGKQILERGICFSLKDSIPTINDFHTSDSTKLGKVTTYLVGLNPDTTYYLRAYASNVNGTGYGSTLKVRTSKTAIRPLDYFPVFPGSIWIYDSGDTLKVNNEYKTYIFCPGYSSNSNDTLILPYIESNYNLFGNHYVKGYELSNGPACPGYHDSPFYPILSDIENSKFYASHYSGGHQNTGITLKVDTSIIVNKIKYDNVLVTEQYDAYFLAMGISRDKCWFLKDYYAKNIGLVLRQKRNFPLDTLVTNITLKSYKINK